MGIDVGVGTGTMREPRSHIEGATPSTAIWSFGVVPDPFTPPGRQPSARPPHPRRRFLQPDTIEWHLDRVYELTARIEAAKRAKEQPNVPRPRWPNSTRHRTQSGRAGARRRRVRRPDANAPTISRRRPPRRRPPATRRRPRALQRRGRRAVVAADHVEMTFNVYRTTKGKVGEPVYAEIQAINPRTGREFEGDVFPIKEYYTNRVQLPASILAGSGGALRIEIRCLSPTQYLGMSESDLYLLAESGNFGFNYMKGLFGVWLQAMVLTAIGVCAGTFLSWPVALLDHHRLLRRRPARFRLPGRLLATGDPGRRPVRVVDPDPHARQPDVGSDPDRRRRPRQDARLAGHARDVDAGLPRA